MHCLHYHERPDRLGPGPVPASLRWVRRAGLSVLCAGCLLGCRNLADNATPVSQLSARFLAAPSKPIPTLSLAALAQGQAPPFLLMPGDVLRVYVHGAQEPLGTQGTAARVNQSGMIVLPMVGAVRVGELSLAQAEAIIAKAFRDAQLIKRPQVFVDVVGAEGNWIAVTGAVAAPGLHEFSRRASSVLAVLAKAGGLSPEASPFVEIARSQQDGVLRLDLLNPESIRKAGRNLWLSNGDLVRVLPWQREVVYITGLVGSSGPVSLPKDGGLDLLSAIGLAGGIDPIVQPTKVIVVRSWNRDGKREMTKILINLAEATGSPEENIILQDGDYVAVVHDPTSFLRAILLNALYLRAGASIDANPIE